MRLSETGHPLRAGEVNSKCEFSYSEILNVVLNPRRCTVYVIVFVCMPRIDIITATIVFTKKHLHKCSKVIIV
jgi:hypothetical protein